MSAFQDAMKDNFCWGCGADNPDGLQLKSHWEGDESVGSWMPSPQYAAGPRHFLNGGVIATLLDCHGVVTAIADAYRREGREIGSEPDIWHATTAMQVEYLRPIPIDAEVRLRGTVTEVAEDGTTVSCTLEAAGKERAQASVTSIRVPDSWRHGAQRSGPHSEDGPTESSAPSFRTMWQPFHGKRGGAAVLLIALRDLQWRRRRFLIAVLATSLVFALTLLLSGAGNGLRNEASRTVQAFDADAWFVAEGASGPFTTSSLLPESTAADVAGLDGVEQADPFLFMRSTSDTSNPTDVNVIGFRAGGLGTPEADEGRRRAVEARRWSTPASAATSARRSRSAARPSSCRAWPTTSASTSASPPSTSRSRTSRPWPSRVSRSPPPWSRGAVPNATAEGLTQLTNAQVVSDMRRPMASGLQTIDFINALLWLIAAGIIGSIVYLSALERTRDFAVMKATGAGNGPLLAGLALQALVLSAASAAVAVVLARPLKAGFPFSIDIPSSAYVILLVVALLVGFMASLAGLRRAVRVDPAVAFGGG